MRRPARRAQRTSARGTSAPPVPTSRAVMDRPAGTEATSLLTWRTVKARPPKRPFSRATSARDWRRWSMGTGPSSISTAPSARRSGRANLRASFMLPAEQRALRGKPGSERDHQPPVARRRFAGAQELVEHEQDRGRGHVPEVAQHVARVGDMALVEPHELLRVVDHATAGRVQDEMPDLALLETGGGEEHV